MNIKNESKISKDCSTQWITDVLNMGAHSRLRSIIKTPKNHKDGSRNPDSYLRFCTKCRRTWEAIPLGYKEKRVYHTYSHVSGYGKKKKVCIDCR